MLELRFEGHGLHTGVAATLSLCPSRTGGIRFRRIDLPGAPEVPAALACAVPSARCTTLGRDGVTVMTVEHLLAAMAARGAWSAECLLAGPEVPALDGGAAVFAEALRAWPAADPPAPLRVSRPVSVRLGGARARLRPAGELRVSVRIDLRDARPQGLRARAADFDDLAPARTFAHLDEVVGLRREGLALGGSLANALVIAGGRPLNPGRFPDEPARHKVLDVMGDLALLGAPLLGHVVAVRPGHRLIAALLAKAVAEGALRP